MGYYKSTQYYGPNAEDYSDPAPEARAARRVPRQHRTISRWPDTAVCIVCEAQALEGTTWVEGICTNCRALTR